MRNLLKNIIIIVLVFLIISGIFAIATNPFEQTDEIPLSTVVQEINNGNIKKITVTGNELAILFHDDREAMSHKEAESSLTESLTNYGVNPEQLATIELVTDEDSSIWTWLGPLMIYLLPLLLFVGFFFFIFRQARSGATEAFSFTKARARLFGAEGHGKEKITFKDVAGLQEAKEELKEIVDFLKNPKKYLRMGAKIPRGVLLLGGAGVGKTLLARAVAGEANVPFFSISGSEFVEMFVGVGSSVSKDTPVLIRTENTTKLLPISEFVDQYYPEGKEGYMVPIQAVQTLGHKPQCDKTDKSNKKFFGGSAWQTVKGVFRHKVDTIYEIHYLGGIIKTTGDHSIFVRDKNRIIPKKVSDLKIGEKLVNLPFKVRGAYSTATGTPHYVRKHQFSEHVSLELEVWTEDTALLNNYQFALENRGILTQNEIASRIGVSQAAVGLWQRSVTFPRALSLKAMPSKKKLPQNVGVSPELLRLLGYYTAEGRRTPYAVQFVFGAHEQSLHEDCIILMERCFHLTPHLEKTPDNTLRITYHSKTLGDFFERHCGNGSHHKHIPEFLWDLPQKYFLGYLQGYTQGDGYTTSEGKLCASSVSKQLIMELAWLAAMHGIQVGITKTHSQGGRIIKNKPLPRSAYWVLHIGKTTHPLTKEHDMPFQFKKPVIQKIVKKPYQGYVYDLCGCENEAFFGGEKPVLLHNSRVRDLFSTAKKAAPAIIFIDELDAIGRHRGAGIGGGHDEREQTLNQILVEMDGFERDTNLIVMSATNRGDILDPALLRPGRFDRKIILDPPDIKDREAILKIHAYGKPLAADVNFREVAERTPGFSGADIANVVNEAAILAARRNKTQITQTEFLESIEKVLLGPERRSHVLSQKEKEIAAFHEVGHALVSASLPGTEPVRKISIISRGMAAGYTLKVPSKEKRMKTKEEFLAELATLLGGYSAEKIVFGDITTGAANDLRIASELARKLVKEYGMSSLGPIAFGDKEEMVFLGKEISEQRNYSEAVATQIDKEVARFITEAQKTAMKILTKKRTTLDHIAKTLIEKETIEREEFETLLKAEESSIASFETEPARKTRTSKRKPSLKTKKTPVDDIQM